MVTEDLSPYAANADRPVPGMAKLKRQVSRLRAALVVVLVLLIVVGVWAVIGVTSLSSTVSSLETKVEKLQSETSAQAAGGGSGNAASGGSGNAAQQQSITAATSLPDGTPMPVGSMAPARARRSNVIAGNTGNGIDLGPGTRKNTVLNNYVGVSRLKLVFPNTGRDIVNRGTDNVVKRNTFAPQE